MLHVADAIDLICARGPRLPAISLPITAALGYTLAADVVAEEDLPAFDNSAVDGFAVHSADLAGATPELPSSLVCEVTIAAGADQVPPLPPSRAARVVTGAPLPAGADAVVPCEQAARDEQGQVLFMAEPAVGANCRRRGCDLRRGATMLTAGTTLRPADLMLLAALGQTSVSVARRPRLALITCGDALVPVGQQPARGQVRDCNLLGLPLALAQAGAEVVGAHHVVDSPAALEEALGEYVGLDAVLTVGGVSAGTELVRAALDRLGRREFWRVAVKPGKPLLFGRLGEAAFFGLPGNPVSALVAIDLFVRPALDAMLGRQGGRRRVAGVWAGAVQSDVRRAEYVRVVAEPNERGVWVATPTGCQSSGRLTTMIGANAYGVIPVGVAGVAPGDAAMIELFEQGVGA